MRSAAKQCMEYSQQRKYKQNDCFSEYRFAYQERDTRAALFRDILKLSYNIGACLSSWDTFTLPVLTCGRVSINTQCLNLGCVLKAYPRSARVFSPFPKLTIPCHSTIYCSIALIAQFFVFTIFI